MWTETFWEISRECDYSIWEVFTYSRWIYLVPVLIIFGLIEVLCEGLMDTLEPVERIRRYS